MSAFRDAIRRWGARFSGKPRRKEGTAGRKAATPEEVPKQRNIPMPARVIATVLGVVVIDVSCNACLNAHPLHSMLIMAGACGLVIGGDLLHGGIRGQWPILALLWMIS